LIEDGNGGEQNLSPSHFCSLSIQYWRGLEGRGKDLKHFKYSDEK